MKQQGNRLLNRLKEERGASVSLALLFFILCAVIGSVVLTAGTVAAGRVRRISDSDKAYRNVVSAANVLKESLNGAQTVATRYRTGHYTRTTTFTVDADEVVVPGSVNVGEKVPQDPEFDYSIAPVLDGSSAVTLNTNFLWDLAGAQVIGDAGTNEGIWNYETPSSGSKEFHFTMKPDFTGTDDLTVTVDGELTFEDRSLLLTLSSGGSTCKVALQAQVAQELTEHETVQQLSVTPDAVNSSSYTRVDDVTVTQQKVDTVRWSVISVTME